MNSPEIATLRKMVVEQADSMGEDGWSEISVPAKVAPSGRLRVPRGAFEMWAVERSNGAHLTVGWKPVSPSGLKIMGDDPYHTDWMLGAGLGLHDMRYSEALCKAAYAAKAEVERRLLGFDCSILLHGPAVTGRVWSPMSSSERPPEADEDGLPPVMVVRSASVTWMESQLPSHI